MIPREGVERILRGQVASEEPRDLRVIVIPREGVESEEHLRELGLPIVRDPERGS